MSHVRSHKELAETVDAPHIAAPVAPRPSLLARLPQLPATPKGVRIVRAADNAAHFDAEAALAAAHAETKRLKVDISSAIEQGREEGYASGREQAQGELAIEVHRVQRQLEAWQAEARETIVDLSIRIAERLVGTLDIEETTRANIIQQTLKHANDSPYTLQVASDVLPLARRALRDLEEDHPGVPVPILRLDSRLPDSRAVLVTRFGSIDLDVTAQLEAIRASLLGSTETEA
jgi:flagellar biosynthesis/type III secretory pathway protein FliH